MKRCANPKCNRVFTPPWNENRSEFCPDCRKKGVRQDVYRMKHENARIGNSKQDASVLSFLKNKRNKEDDLYYRAYTLKEPDAIEELRRKRIRQDNGKD